MQTTRFTLSLIVLILTILVTSSKAEVTTNVTQDVNVQTNVTTQSDNPGTGDVTTTTETITTTTTTTDTTTTTTTTVPGETKSIVTFNEHHTVNICSQSNTTCTGLIQNSTGLGSGGGWGVEMGYSGGTLTINKDLDDYFTQQQQNAGFTGSLSADIMFNCGNRIGGDCSSGTNDRVILKQTYTDNNGNIITQSRTIDGFHSNFQNYGLDNVTVNSNNASNWTGKAEIYGQDLGYWGPSGSEYYGPHIDNINWDITINGGTTTSSSTTTDVAVDVSTAYSTSIQYCWELNTCPASNTTATDIANATVADDGKTYDEFIDDKLKDINVEDLTLVNTTVIVQDDLGNIKEIEVDEYVETNFEKFVATNNLTETFETALVEENITKEEFYDTMTTELKEEFSDDLTNDTKSEDLNTDTETNNIEEANADTTTTKETTEIGTETNTESETTETNSTESDVVENKETEGSETETNTKETVDAKETGDVKTDGGKTVDNSSIEKKVERVIAKVLSKIKEVDKKLQAVQYITTQGIKSGEADISNYINKRIYGNQNLYSNVPFYENLNILEQQQIYKDVSLNTYVSNDPIAVKQRLTVEIESEISRIQAELYALKQKRGS